jgi:acyl-CoA synthetase (NDP forming)
VAQVISSGFGETDGGKELEASLVAEANAAGVRILGPNCLGTYSPGGGLTFPVDAPKEAGPIGIISQSGGLTTDIIKRGQWRGLRFSGAVTIGNSADVSPTELAEYYFADPGTRAVGVYLEDVKDGRAFFDLLRNSASAKPVVLMKGGRSALGRLAASSHTGALAGDERVWDALCRQTGTVMVDMVDDFLDALVALQFLELRSCPTRKVVLFGNGGGTSVLATDYFASKGLEIVPFESALRERLQGIGLPPGTSFANPIDAPVRSMQQENGKAAEKVLDIVCTEAQPDAVVMHLNLAAFVGRGPVDPLDNLVQAIVNVKARSLARTHFLLVLRSDGSERIDGQRRYYREKAQALGVPVFNEMANAATALAALGHFERQEIIRSDEKQRLQRPLRAAGAKSSAMEGE